MYQIYQKVDFTELLRVDRFKYLLFLVDHLSGWVETFPSVSATASTVAKVILEQIIPIIENIDSEQGSRFISQILQGLIWTWGTKREFHAPWHPSSSGRVEWMDQIIIKNIYKKIKKIINLVLETWLSWTKCLHLVLLQTLTASRKDMWLSLYDILFELPYLGRAKLPNSSLSSLQPHPWKSRSINSKQEIEYRHGENRSCSLSGMDSSKCSWLLRWH